MNFRNIMIALQTLFVVAGNIQTLPVHGAHHADDPGVPHIMSQETAFPPLPGFYGNVVAVLPSGRAIGSTAIMRGKRFEWLGKIDNRVAGEERKAEAVKAIDIKI